MWGDYRLDAARTVESAGHSYFRVSSQHPDRIMAYHDLIYMLEGEWGIGQGNEHFLLRPGHVLILHAGQHHFGTQPCSPETRTMYVHFSDEGDRIPQRSDDLSLPSVLPSLIDCSGSTRIRRLFTDLIYFQTANSVNREIICASTVRLLLCELSNIVHGQEASRMVVYRSIRFMQDNPGRFIHEDELAAHLSVSSRTLRDQFKTATGKTPYRYQLEQKLHAVADMLLFFPEMTLRELAFNYGFCDEFHLSKAFKRFYGKSPADYRKRP